MSSVLCVSAQMPATTRAGPGRIQELHRTPSLAARTVESVLTGFERACYQEAELEMKMEFNHGGSEMGCRCPKKLNCTKLSWRILILPISKYGKDDNSKASRAISLFEAKMSKAESPAQFWRQQNLYKPKKAHFPFSVIMCVREKVQPD